MKRFIFCCAFFALTLQAVPSAPAANAISAQSSKRSESSKAEMAALAAKLDSLSKFVAAGDAASLAGLWAQDGSFVDDSGTSYQGRSALQKRFENVFAAGEKPSVSLKQDRAQVLSPTVIVSEGTVLRKQPSGESVADTKYSFVFVKNADGWYISSATETPITAPDNADAPKVSLEDLSWLVGDWKAERDGRSLKLHVDWTGNKNFLRWVYQISKQGEPTQEDTEFIGFDPKSGELLSWSFDSSGMFGQSAWTKDATQWQLESIKTARDGSTLTARNIIVPKGNNSFTWQSLDRTAGGMPLPDTGELQINREVK
jgi:uncharacterized protein (TIGR02246 family)